MDWTRWLSLAVVAVYVVVVGFGLLSAEDSRPLASQDLFNLVIGGGLWLAVCLGCIWWGDELGEGIVGAKFGLISSTSPGWAVKLLGWVLLLLPAAVVLLRGRAGE
ncbi:MAG: hypothetical protein ABFE13_09930 [Phycisphaerales bacterium]